MLELDAVSVWYGHICALQQLHLSVAQGEIVGLVGPNGAGKSSTLRAIAGVAPIRSGHVRLRGEDITGRSPEHIVRQGVALVPEGREIFGTLTVGENLLLGTTPLSDRAAAQAAIERELERFPILRTYFGKNAGQLSGGEQQQLAIARALVSNPRLLLLDEPSLGLAPLVIDLVYEVLAGLREDGVTILLVEQHANRTVELADRSYVLRTGMVSLEGTREELVATADLATAYMGL
jgi:branched-chain amino acid transport system ATP-binding protein